MKFSTKLAVTLPSILLTGAFAAGPAIAAGPAPDPTPPMQATLVVGGDYHHVMGDQQNGHGAIHMGSGSGHVLGNVGHSILTHCIDFHCTP
ncbi:hypothetical protein ACTVZO_00070 [Streptomyces sp. IBSNAI002]|uniref:hypothetical protein n=1 Tax=Streptomyces sp. IBSNAI002 TaxID=3457500 RepID=UPI003FCF46F9